VSFDIKGCGGGSGTLHAGTSGTESMRAETHSLVDEIKQSLKLLRRHL
jgi:hypothetical protein